MSDKSRPNAKMTELSRAITRALAKSDEVIHILNDLKKMNSLNSKAMIALILKANDLLAISETGNENRALPEKAASRAKLLPVKSGPGEEYIDGRKLSKKEIEFQEYCSGQFDEEEWLGKLKITIQ